jgi:hypothetical protein
MNRAPISSGSADINSTSFPRSDAHNSRVAAVREFENLRRRQRLGGNAGIRETFESAGRKNRGIVARNMLHIMGQLSHQLVQFSSDKISLREYGLAPILGCRDQRSVLRQQHLQGIQIDRWIWKVRISQHTLVNKRDECGVCRMRHLVVMRRSRRRCPDDLLGNPASDAGRVAVCMDFQRICAMTPAAAWEFDTQSRSRRYLNGAVLSRFELLPYYVQPLRSANGQNLLQIVTRKCCPKAGIGGCT